METDYSDITFRPLDLSDADDFMEWYSDEKVSEFCSWNTFTSKEAAIQYVADTVIQHPWHKAICLTNKPIGSISVTPFSGDNSCRAELGYVLGSKYWGKGIATAAVKMAAAEIFVEWPHLERLQAVVAVENLGSQRVLEKAGFTREGVLRKYYLLKGKPKDAVIFSLVSTDGKSSPPRSRSSFAGGLIKLNSTVNVSISNDTSIMGMGRITLPDNIVIY